jgi:hypothetical protein
VKIVEAFGDREAPRYLIRGRDGVYGNAVRRRLESLRIEEVLTAPQSPVAECVRGASDRIDTTGMPEPLHRAERQSFKEDVETFARLSTPSERPWRLQTAAP